MADSVDSHRDLRLQDGRWSGQADVLADCPDGADVAEFLHTQGWEAFVNLGSIDDEVYLWSWQRGRDNGTDEYLLQVASGTTVDRLPPYLLFDSLPELLDALSRWSPLLQAAAVAGLLEQLRAAPADGGLVETLAGRAAYGAQHPRTPRRAAR